MGRQRSGSKSEDLPGKFIHLKLSGERLEKQFCMPWYVLPFGIPCLFSLIIVLRIPVSILLLFGSMPILAQSRLGKDTLMPVKVWAAKPVMEANAAIPVQQLDQEKLTRLNCLSVADAVKYFSGVVVKDYGGIGGLKTVSVRSLGANHTGVMYDGLMMNDAQAGQTDLGRFSIDNISLIQLFNPHQPSLLQPARNFSYAAILSMTSRVEEINKHSELTAKIRGGSFGFFNPSIYFAQPFKGGLSVSGNAEMQVTDGDYPFRDYETGNASVRRINSDVKNYRLETDLAYQLKDSGVLKAKVYFYDDKRGLPGAVVLYNRNAGDRLNSRLFFTQASWRKKITSKSQVLVSGKYTADQKYYLDPNFPNSAGKIENDFRQREYYISAVYASQLTENLGFSLASDYQYNQLRRNDPFATGFANPNRGVLMTNLALKYERNRYHLFGNLLFTGTADKVATGKAAKPYRELTPSLAASFRLTAHSPLRLRLSYKRIFRLPTFDDLYYTNVGNASLSPEYAHCYNIGVTGQWQQQHYFQRLFFTVDMYYNQVRDKILALPRQNLFQWSMQNIGLVNIKGADLAVQADFGKQGSLQTSVHLSYSYQDARDFSNPASVLYKTQLPYTPKHSGSVNLGFSWKAYTIGYNVLLSSYRYRAGEPNNSNLVKEWATQDLSVRYALPRNKNFKVQILAELNNIFDQQYEIIRYYPMPGRNFRVGISFSKKVKRNHNA